MKKSLKKAAKLTLAAGLLCAGSAFASPVNDSTAYLFSNDMDNINSVINWSGVSFDKWMVAADLYYNQIDIAGAFKMGNLVIVPSFCGNGISTYLQSTATETVSYTMDDGVPAGSTVTTSLDPDSNSMANHYIQPGVLIGLGNLGIKFNYGITNNTRFDFYEPSTGNSGATNTSTTVKDKDGKVISSSSTEYTKGKSLNLANAPSISAGMVLKAGDVVYKPYAELKTSIISTGIVTEKKVTSTDTSATQTDYTRDTVNNQIRFSPNAGVAIVVPGKNEKVKHAYNASYTGDYDLYATNYKDAFGNKKHFGTFTGYTENSVVTNPDGSKQTSVTVGGTEGKKSYLRNKVRGEYKITYDPSDVVHLAAKAVVNTYLDYNSTKTNTVNTSKTVSTNQYGESTTTETTTTGASSKVENFSVDVYPYIYAGLVYEIKPGKFNLNVGTEFTVPSYKYSTTKTTNPDLEKSTSKTTDSNGNVTSNTTSVTYADQSASKTDTTTFGKFYTNLYTGFSFFVSENVELDASLLLGITNTGSSIFSSSLTAGCVVKF